MAISCSASSLANLISCVNGVAGGGFSLNAYSGNLTGYRGFSYGYSYGYTDSVHRHLGCPDHSDGPLDINHNATTCTCIDPYVPDPTQMFCVDNGIFTITLRPAGTYLPSNGTYTIQPSNLLPLYAVVENQNGVVQAGIQVSLTVNVSDGSGGHIHTENRPQGGFVCSSVYDPGTASATCILTTDSNGQAPFAFLPTAVSGAHTITAHLRQLHRHNDAC